MTESWMPSDERIDNVVARDEVRRMAGQHFYRETKDLIREAVEKAVAEQSARELRDFLGWQEQEMNRHARELERARLEAKIEAAFGLEWECPCEASSDCHNHQIVDGWRAALAALDKEPQP